MSDTRPPDSTRPSGVSGAAREAASEAAKPSAPAQPADRELTPDQLEQCIGGLGDRGVIPDFLR